MKKLVLLSLVLLLSACATTAPRTSIDYDPAVDFAQLRTYSWLDHDLAGQGVSPLWCPASSAPWTPSSSPRAGPGFRKARPARWWWASASPCTSSSR
ncbi:hypothetical protein [Arenimonas daejeonensis]|uniref:hypothetical protein n=1 Tax=Arenimonas daejeonensis TaxID=370777 RepID=UPI001315ACAF|nr:hypothetical protein [Arenimonas daejeonensis]